MANPEGPATAKTGRMTAVMRATNMASGPRILRVALVQNGKVVDERLLKRRVAVTIGPHERATFVANAAGDASVRLFDVIKGDYYLCLDEGVSGRVWLPSGPVDLATLRGTTRVHLSDESRGRITLGELTFLFQLVPPPPVAARPALPSSVRAGERVDWALTTIAALSFLLHFGAIGSFYADWSDRIVDDQASVAGLVETIARLPPPPEPEAAPAANETSPATTPTTAAPRAASTAKRSDEPGARKAGSEATAKASLSKSDAAALLAKLDRADVQTLGALTSGQAATGNVLREGLVPTDKLDGFAASSSGVGQTGPGGLKLEGPGLGAMVPGTTGTLAQVGSQRGAEGTRESSGLQTKVEGPKASLSASGSVTVGKINGAERVLAGARGRVRGCYQTGLATNEAMEGRVSFTIAVGGTGAVQSVSTSPSGSLSSGVVSCVQGVLRGLAFEPPENGAATLTGSYAFLNGNRGK